MNLKKIILFTMLLNYFTIVQAETLEEKVSALNTKVNQFAENGLTTEDLYSVGSIYITTSSTSPATLFGGTWEIYDVDKQLVGVGSNDTTTYSASVIGGSATKTLATVNLPAHAHSITPSGTIVSTFTGSQVTTSSSGAHTHTISWYQSGNEASGYGMGRSTYYQNRVMLYNGWEDKYTVKSTSSNFSASTHSVTPKGTVTSTFTGTSVDTSSVGTGSSFDVRNPYITVYMWKRTA